MKSFAKRALVLAKQKDIKTERKKVAKNKHLSRRDCLEVQRKAVFSIHCDGIKRSILRSAIEQILWLACLEISAKH